MIPLARYLFTRLRQQNVHALHGVPGDYTLKALDHAKAAGLKCIGNCNELNAGYAADGYARVRGLGALMTTFGVGELSAINAIAGSYSEQVPVVHIVGTPPLRLQKTEWRHLHLHHSLADGRLGVFREIAEKVSAAQVNLNDPSDAAEKVDWVIGEALRLSQPVYVELPSDMVATEVEADRLQTLISAPKTGIEKAKLEKQADSLLERIRLAKSPILLVDRGHGVDNLRDDINEFARRSGLPVLCMPSGAGMIENSLENYCGIHSGPAGKMDSMALVDEADLVLAFGPMFTDTQTLGFRVVPPRDKMVILKRHDIDGEPTDLQVVVKSLVRKVDASRSAWDHSHPNYPYNRDMPKPASLPTNGLITQNDLYERLNTYLRPDDAVILGNGTPLLGAREFRLPPGARVFASGVAFSIGHFFAATQGIALAQPKGRTILIEGDGNAQMTIQELSTLIRERLNATIIIINNHGYCYERLIHGRHEEYNDLAPWQYLLAPKFFGAPDDYPVETHQIRTWGDLDSLLESDSFQRGEGLKLVEIILDKFDVPDTFRGVFEQAGKGL
ncbi:pyruvate decarboxylase [Thozetella sp. PMI_491]|nr:pyruvate decarboxylase [Thozetella sp. PMI_491]